MLKIFTMNIIFNNQLGDIPKSNFKQNPNSTGEILWNFLEHQIIKFNQTYENSPKDRGLGLFIFRYLLPYIAYQIERNDKLYFTDVDLDDYINDSRKEYDSYIKEYKNELFDLVRYKTAINDIFINDDRINKLIDLLSKNICIVKFKERNNKKTYDFYHQHFRDILSAIHIKNHMKLNEKTVFTDRIFPPHIYIMLSDILQEHKNIKPSRLRKYLKIFEDKSGEDAQTGVYNCLQIIDYASNGNMIKEDFSRLDLRKYSFAGKNFKSCDFSGSFITHRLIWPENKNIRATFIDFEPNGSHIAVANWKNIDIWDSKTGNLIRTLFSDYFMDGEIKCVKYSPNGEYIVSGCTGNSAKIWKSDTGERCQILLGNHYRKDSYTGHNHSLGHIDTVVNACFSPPNGEFVLTGSDDGTIKIWDSTTGTLIHSFEFDSSWRARYVFATYNSDGSLILAASACGNIKVWESKNNYNLLRTFYDDRVRASSGPLRVSFSPDEKYILPACSFGGVVFKYETGEPINFLKLDDEMFFRNAIYSLDGKYIIASDNHNLYFVEVAAGFIEKLDGFEHIQHICHSADNKLIIADRSAIKILDIHLKKIIRTIKTLEWDETNYASFSHDAKNFVSSQGKKIKIWSWDNEKGHIIHILNGHSDIVNSVYYSPDGKYIISSSSDNSIKIWDSQTGIFLKTLDDNASAFGAKYSPNGKYIISISKKGDSINIWESITGILLNTINIPDSFLYNPSFHPNEILIMYSNKNNGKIQVLDVSASDVVYSFDYIFYDVSTHFSPDGKYIMTDSYIREAEISENKSGIVIQKIISKEYLKIEKEKIFKILDEKNYGSLTQDEIDEFLLSGEQAKESYETKINYSLDGRFIILVTDKNTIQIRNRDSFELISTLYPLQSEIIGAIFKDKKNYDLNDSDYLILEQNGAIIE